MLQQQSGINQDELQEMDYGRSMHRHGSNQQILQQEIVEEDDDIEFYKERINKSEARYAQLADEYRRLLANQNGQESRTSHLV